MWKHIFSNRLKFEQQNAASKRLILSVLNSTATKREARDYLAKYANEDAAINHCLLFVRHLHDYSGKTLGQLSNSIKRLRMLGLRPICIIPPSKHVEKQAEVFDKLITKAQLRPLHLRDGLSKSRTGLYHSVLSSHSQLFNDMISDMVPIIKPYIYNEETASEFMAYNIVNFMDKICQNVTPHIDKFFILNKIGGIPSGERNDNPHVFINLSQEYNYLLKDLNERINSVSMVKDVETDDLLQRMTKYVQKKEIANFEESLHEHIEDLKLMNTVLTNLSPSSTGLITTVNSAALPSDKKNPLVYNLLTDRSIISSSLPRFKRDATEKEELDDDWSDDQESAKTISEQEHIHASNAILMTTVFKKGVHIRIYDSKTLTADNSVGLPNTKYTGFHANDQVDLVKIKQILDRSFRRSLDLEHYLERINGNIASIIVIGDYEGIAILTYEGPKDNPFVYLDKFAVLPHLKGSLGISDIIFNLMFKRYPKEVIWRSRKDNVVNKWYFQRSVAVIDLSIKLTDGDQADSQFKMFYYGNTDANDKPNLILGRLETYAKYVRDIKPSWKK